MKETIINFDNKKRGKTLIFGIALVVASLLFVYYLVAFAPKIEIYYLLLFLLCAGMGTYMLIVGIKNYRDKDRSGLILNAEGLVFKGTPVARKIGLVKWADITSLSTGKVFGSSFVFLKLKNPEQYLQQVAPQIQKSILAHGLGVTDNELDIDFAGLQNLLEQYYNASQSAQ
ncbi:hypothetical protein DBR32_08580 [Taibaiella sp. KBW10]|uniref:STM3941 family protein n=1 Tax=Taibaiella sp. KBW10 TaxID=2153357 RepID=UPI000F5B6129|nr:STM3941 family protein [Taibaiella sp. KBW10]RQO30770.1 hypothetical protein DBR32_08580 [Taibaiella sp. KBW10]